MAPKLKAVSELGSVQANGHGWRARVQFNRELMVSGPTYYGRAARRKAEASLAQAQLASTREEMQQRPRDMMVASGQPAAPLVAVGHPEQVSTAPSVVAAPAAFSVAIVPLQQVGAPGLPRKRLCGNSMGSDSLTW